jgi:HEAT repeat protein
MLSGGSKEAIELLQGLMKNDSADIRLHAASGLLAADHKNAEAIKYLRERLNSDYSLERAATMEALAEIGPAAEPLVRDIVKMLEGTDDVDRIAKIAGSLQKIGSGCKDAVPQLEELLKRRNLKKENIYYQVPQEVAHALACEGKEGEAVLIRVLKDPDAPNRGHAAAFLREFGDKASSETVDALVDELKNEESTIKCGAIVSLGRIGKPAKKALPLLKRIADKELSKPMEEEEFHARLFAHWAIKRISE